MLEVTEKNKLTNEKWLAKTLKWQKKVQQLITYRRYFSEFCRWCLLNNEGWRLSISFYIFMMLFFSCSSFTQVSANLSKITVIFLVKVDNCSIFIVKFQNKNKYLRHILLLIYNKICCHYCHFFLKCTIPISIFKWNKTKQIIKQTKSKVYWLLWNEEERSYYAGKFRFCPTNIENF